MPWDQILSALHELEEQDVDAPSIELPHAGDELSRWVQVLLKTSGAEEAADLAAAPVPEEVLIDPEQVSTLAW